MKQKKSHSSFIFLTAAIRAMEARALTEDMVERMIKSSSPEEAVEALRGTDYYFYFKEEDRAFNQSKFMEWRYQALFDFIRPFINPDLFRLMALPFDYHNIKVLLKDKIFEKDHSELLLHRGSVNTEELKEIFNSEDYSSLPGPLSDSITRATESYYETKSVNIIESVLDRGMFEQAFILCGSLESEIISMFWRISVDVYNIMSRLRTAYFRNQNTLQEPPLPGGLLLPDELLEAESGELAIILDRHNELALLGRAVSTAGSDLLALEREGENTLTAWLGRHRFLLWGPEPVYSHARAVETELKVLSLITGALKNNIPEQTLRRRLPRLYGGSF